MTRLRLSLLALAIGVVACAAPPAGSVLPPTADPVELEIQPPVDGLPYDDPRLDPVLAELRRHPEWLDAALGPSPIVVALVPSTEELCLALRGPGGDVHVTIDPKVPWSVLAVGIDRGPAGREFTFDPDDAASDVCTFVTTGRAEPWPMDAEAIEVQGNVSADEARAIAAALHRSPQGFGVDRHGVPAINVGDRVEPGADGWTCSRAFVFVGGPRSVVVVGTRRNDGGWEVTTRVVDAALRDAEERRPGHC